MVADRERLAAPAVIEKSQGAKLTVGTDRLELSGQRGERNDAGYVASRALELADQARGNRIGNRRKHHRDIANVLLRVAAGGAGHGQRGGCVPGVDQVGASRRNCASRAGWSAGRPE